MNNTITYQYLKDTLLKNKANQHLADLIKFFLSKPPEYWSTRPDEVYAVYTDLLEIENTLQNNV
jgi:hypothetical protein